MRIRKKIIISTLLVIIFFSNNSLYAKYNVGDTVSDFTLEEIDMGDVNLFSYRGKIIHLNFFATW